MFCTAFVNIVHVYKSGLVYTCVLFLFMIRIFVYKFVTIMTGDYADGLQVPCDTVEILYFVSIIVPVLIGHALVASELHQFCSLTVYKVVISLGSRQCVEVLLCCRQFIVIKCGIDCRHLVFNFYLPSAIPS